MALGADTPGSDNALSACCDAVCESAAWRTTVQRVEAKELSRVVGDNAAGIPSLLSGRRKTYKPNHRLYGLPSDFSEHLHQFILPHSLAPVAFQNRFTEHPSRSNFRIG